MKKKLPTPILSKARKRLPTRAPNSRRDSGKSNAIEAYDLVLGAIERGELKSGMRVREEELAERYGISRTPVREALKRLEAHGLMSHTPHLGCVVATLDYSQLAELYLMREILEGTAARLAASRATFSEIELLGDILERDRSLMEDPDALAESNRRFHRHILLVSRNDFLRNTLENMGRWMTLVAGTTLRIPQRARQSIAEHEAIFKGIRTHNADQADTAARVHIGHAFKAQITRKSF